MTKRPTFICKYGRKEAEKPVLKTFQVAPNSFLALLKVRHKTTQEPDSGTRQRKAHGRAQAWAEGGWGRGGGGAGFSSFVPGTRFSPAFLPAPSYTPITNTRTHTRTHTHKPLLKLQRLLGGTAKTWIIASSRSKGGVNIAKQSERGVEFWIQHIEHHVNIDRNSHLGEDEADSN